MALNITQAAAVNTVIDALARREPRRGFPVRTEKDLRGALVVLAAGANKALMAGIGPDQVASMEFPHYVADPTDFVSVESIRAALRDAHRNDSAADAVEFVSDLVGWLADEDPELLAEGASDGS